MFASDSSTGGNIYVYDDLTTSKAVTNGDTVQFNPGDLTINLG